MLSKSHFAILTLFFVIALPTSQSSAFSFSEYEAEEARQENANPGMRLDSLHCPQSLKQKKIATMIGEEHKDERTGRYRIYFYRDTFDGVSHGTTRAAYGNIIDNLNNGFHQLGLRTYTAEQINEQIAAEEQEAFLNNDLDAALSASSRLSADYMVKGKISTTAGTNKVVKVDELFVTINLSLVDGSGRQLAMATVSDATYTDTNVTATVHRLIEKHAEHIVATLFSKICHGEQQ